MTEQPSLDPRRAAVPCGLPATRRPAPQPGAWWPGVIVIVIVIATSVALLLSGRALDETLLTAGAVVLLAGEVARRTVGVHGPLPTALVTAAVAVLAGAVLLTGRPPTEVALAVCLTGAVAGRVSTWLFGAPGPRWGV
ncbi:hypothetical protein OG989_05615 [Micromonospora sp. NBC_01740]|uniref:hypothetical protein n=1 Tax=Micromonospora sp. NBC_01740 TaxID=2975986 RepID=UPI002E0FF8B6|nr:hypothetical protein OG989_05615 [Micromonospora sp. NBC_01740]